DADNIPSSCASSVIGNTTCFVSLEGVIDFDKEISRLEKELGKNTKELLTAQKRLNNESFLEKAPEDVILKVKSQYADIEEKNNKLKENLERIQKMK
ncbi:MAG: valine--tRNA ligase, partial [Desulfobacula sp.]|nr:valine--tRNA ligase [Desulfobacula sp.]